jgi:hypothetical protein
MVEMTATALDVLRTGLDWLYSTEQPDDESIVSHHGINAPVVEGRRYRFVPSGFQAAPVIVVNVVKPRYTGPLDNQRLVNPLEPGELAALQAQIEQWGHEVGSSWNGEGETGSVGLATRAHPSLLAALDRERKGCPDHPRQILCSWDGCPWHGIHIAKLQVPEGW